ncbi:phosphoglycerate kinase, partial [bacterium AH-315-M05]|nr:phosphoglycerate kinase [bacterium AH-315-M05]
MKTIDNYNFNGKKALVRVDFNVPLNENSQVADDTRIKAALPTINKILSEGGSVILMSHLGRPKEGFEEQLSLKHIVSQLTKILKSEVQFADDCIGEPAKIMAEGLKPG